MCFGQGSASFNCRLVPVGTTSCSVTTCASTSKPHLLMASLRQRHAACSNDFPLLVRSITMWASKSSPSMGGLRQKQWLSVAHSFLFILVRLGGEVL